MQGTDIDSTTNFCGVGCQPLFGTGCLSPSQSQSPSLSYSLTPSMSSVLSSSMPPSRSGTLLPSSSQTASLSKSTTPSLTSSSTPSLTNLPVSTNGTCGASAGLCSTYLSFRTYNNLSRCRATTFGEQLNGVPKAFAVRSSVFA